MLRSSARPFLSKLLQIVRAYDCRDRERGHGRRDGEEPECSGPQTRERWEVALGLEHVLPLRRKGQPRPEGFTNRDS